MMDDMGQFPAVSPTLHMKRETCQFTPTVPSPLLPTAPMMPETPVPWPVTSADRKGRLVEAGWGKSAYSSGQRGCPFGWQHPTVAVGVKCTCLCCLPALAALLQPLTTEVCVICGAGHGHELASGHAVPAACPVVL